MFRVPDTVKFGVPWLVKRVVALPGDPIPPDIGSGAVPPSGAQRRPDGRIGASAR